MSGKSFGTYCTILDYLDAKHPEFAQIIHGLCIRGALTSLHGKNGITLLMPMDKDYVAEIEKLAYSSSIADAEKATNMVLALIVRDVFKTPTEWKSKEAPNALKASQALVVKSVSGAEVIFDSGAKATIDKNFVGRKDNIAVWNLTGRIPVTTDKPASARPAGAKPAGAKRVGGYVPLEDQWDNERFKICKAVEMAYAIRRNEHCKLVCRGQRSMHDARWVDPFVEHSMSLLHYIANVKRDKKLFDKVLPLIGCDKMDFYFLIQPFATENFLIPGDLIIDWYAQHHTMPFVLASMHSQICAALNEHTSNGDTSAVFGKRDEFVRGTMTVRNRILNNAESAARKICDDIAGVYRQLEAENKINGVQFWPEDTWMYYKSSPGLKMIHDELRYVMHGAFDQLEAGRPFDSGRCNELFNIIGDYLIDPVGAEHYKLAKLLNRNSIACLIAPSEKVEDIKIFVLSTSFLYVPLTDEECDALKGTDIRPDPSTPEFYNIVKAIRGKYQMHQAVWNAHGNAQLRSMLDSIKPESLDPELIDALKSKFGLTK